MYTCTLETALPSRSAFSRQLLCQFGLHFLFSLRDCILLLISHAKSNDLHLIPFSMQKRIFQEWVLFSFCWQICKQEIVLQISFSFCLKRIMFFSFTFSPFQHNIKGQKNSLSEIQNVNFIMRDIKQPITMSCSLTISNLKNRNNEYSLSLRSKGKFPMVKNIFLLPPQMETFLFFTFICHSTFKNVVRIICCLYRKYWGYFQQVKITCFIQALWGPWGVMHKKLCFVLAPERKSKV